MGPRNKDRSDAYEPSGDIGEIIRRWDPCKEVYICYAPDEHKIVTGSGQRLELNVQSVVDMSALKAHTSFARQQVHLPMTNTEEQSKVEDEREDEDDNEQQQDSGHDLANATRNVFVHVRQEEKPAKVLLDSGASLNLVSKEKISDWTLESKVKKRSKEDQITLQLGNGSTTVVRGSLELHWGVRGRMRTFTSIFYVCDRMPCDMIVGMKECLKRGLIRFEEDEGAGLYVMISTKSKADKQKIQKLQREADKSNTKKTGEQMEELAQELQRGHIQPSPSQDEQLSSDHLDRLILESIMRSLESSHPETFQAFRVIHPEQLISSFKTQDDWPQHRQSVLQDLRKTATSHGGKRRR